MKKLLLTLSIFATSLSFADVKGDCYEKAKQMALSLYDVNAGGIQGSSPYFRQENFASALQSSQEDTVNKIIKHKLKLTIDDSNDEGESWAVNYYVNVEENEYDCRVRRVAEGRVY